MYHLEKTKLLGSDVDDSITLNSMKVYMEKLYLPVLQDLGIQITPEEFKAMVQPVWGQGAEEVIKFMVGQASVAEGADINPEAILAGVADYEERLRSGVFTDSVELVPGAIDTLESVRARGVQVGLATGLAPEVLNKLFKDNGVPDDLFVGIVSAYDIRKPERKKPHHHSLKRLKRAAEAVRKSGILNKEIVYVGDSENDVKMAQRMSGVEPVVVLTGNLSARQAVEELGLAPLNVLPTICHIEEVLERREKAA